VEAKPAEKTPEQKYLDELQKVFNKEPELPHFKEIWKKIGPINVK
jgi:hypothetical protein